MSARAWLAWGALAFAACRTAPAPPYRPPEQAVRYRSYQVQPGDTLYAIATRHGVSVETLQRINRIPDPTRLQVGQVILVPPAGAPSDGRAKTEGGTVSGTVSGGETGAETMGGTVLGGGASAKTEGGIVLGAGLGGRVAGSCDEVWDAPEAAARSEAGYLWPVEGVVLVRFGMKDGQPHRGLDIGAPQGTPVWASRDGVVVFAGEQPGFGKILVVRHGDGMTLYGRNAEHCVREGERVRQGQALARLGDQDGTGVPYLYFELRIGEQAVDPKNYLPP